mmetsp:Transcript_7851/g.10168  ORF Transcript_7851/g.10168 Transcript_7851/m.10168 type:complete len:239 (-) Transcript_7851:82-798(-)
MGIRHIRRLMGDVKLLEKLFGLLDQDRNDFLSLAELNRFMVALNLEPGTADDFRAFCEQAGASPDIGLSMGDFSAAYAETPSDNLEDVLRVHGKEWAAAAYSTQNQANLPALTGDVPSEEWTFDPSAFYGFDEVITMFLVALFVLVSVVSVSRLRRCYRRCMSEEESSKRDNERLNMIGTTARQIASDLDSSLMGMHARTRGSDAQVMYSGTLKDLDFSELDGMLSKMDEKKDTSSEA